MARSKDALINEFIRSLREQMNSIAHGSMTPSVKDPFDHGVIVGRYLGLQEAEKLLEAAMTDEDDKEKSK